VRARDFNRAVATLDLMIAAAPDIEAWYQTRGALLKEIGRWQAARRDFETYLSMAPDAHDRNLVIQQIQWLARLN